MVISREVVIASIMEAKGTRVVTVDEVEKVINALRDRFVKDENDCAIIWGELKTFDIINGHYVLKDSVDTLKQIRKSMYVYCDFNEMQLLDVIYDQGFVLKTLEKPSRKKTTAEEYIELQKKYIKFLKKLAKENPEAAKEYAIKSLQESGILDEEGNIKAPYNGETVNDSDFTRGPRKSLKKKDK